MRELSDELIVKLINLQKSGGRKRITLEDYRCVVWVPPDEARDNRSWELQIHMKVFYMRISSEKNMVSPRTKMNFKMKKGN